MAIATIIERESGTLYTDAIPVFCYDDGGADVGKVDCANAASAAANSYVGAVATDFRFRRLSDKTARVEVIFNLTKLAKYPKPDNGTVEAGFNFAMGPIQRKYTLGRTKYPSTAPDFGGAIEVPPAATSGIQALGVNLPPPPEVFWRRYYAPNTVLTDAYISTVGNLVGTVTNAVFKGFAAETLCLVRANGTVRDATSWQLYFGWAYAPLVSGLQIGAHALSGSGFDYYWGHPQINEVANGGIQILTPEWPYAYVDQVLPRADHNLLALP